MPPSNHHSSDLPQIVILGTGGTIAGAPDADGSLIEYRPGMLAADAVVESVQGLNQRARLRYEQVANIGSEDMTEAVWLRLLDVADRHLADPETDGVLVVHGTDTMEETAYFLNLTLDSRKPVVLTGALRPPYAPSPDGPMNLLQAVSLAASPEAGGKGVLILMNDAIHAAREAAKTDTLSLDAFRSPNAGPLGRMVDGKPHFLREPLRVHTADSPFASRRPEALPRVEIIYGHAGQRRELIDAAVAAGAQGIVHAGVGMGNIHEAALPALAEAAAKGVAVACSSRVGAGPVPQREALRQNGLIAASDLNPQKARVLLQLALTQTRDPAIIQSMFDRL